MRNLGAREAAEAIRGAFLVDRSANTDPEQQHQMKFAKDVCRELGADESPETVHHVMVLLRQHDIDLHAGHEFPKYATRKWDRTAKIVQNEDEERAWIDEPQPEPVDPDSLPAARVLEAPVQDLSLDLRDKVPHMSGDEPTPAKPPRVPSAITNREAAQDAHARQPAEGRNRDAAAAAYDEANPGLDHTNQDAAEGDGTYENVQDGDVDTDDDDDVHVESVDLNELAGSGDKSKGGAPYAEPAATGVMANDDPDGDGIVGQDVNPTHDSVLGTDAPQNRSGDSSAGKTDTARRPVGNRSPSNKARPV